MTALVFMRVFRFFGTVQTCTKDAPDTDFAGYPAILKAKPAYQSGWILDIQIFVKRYKQRNRQGQTLGQTEGNTDRQKNI